MTDDQSVQPKASSYFANAAAGVMLSDVVEATVEHLRREAAIGAIPAAAEASDVIAAGYAAAADLIGSETDEVAFVESGNRALAALIQSADLQPGDHVLVDRTCWGGTLHMLSSFPGVIVDVMPVDHHGRVDVDATKAQAHPATKLVVLTWCPATCAIFNPAEAVGLLAQDLGAFYIVDACQVAGQRPIDVRNLRCHGLAASGRKWLRGPRGTALLYASREYLTATRPFMADQFGQGRTDARRYETGEANVAGRVGLSVALRATQSIGVDAIAGQLCDFADRLRTRIQAVPGAVIVEQGNDLAGFVTVTGLDVPETIAALARAGITVSTPGRAYAPLDMDARGLTSVIRIAPHVFSTVRDIDALVDALERGAAGNPS